MIRCVSLNASILSLFCSRVNAVVYDSSMSCYRLVELKMNRITNSLVEHSSMLSLETLGQYGK
jgi:hypothetical protein